MTRWEKDDERPMKAQAIKALALNEPKITDVYHHEGTPGGHNNDRVILTLNNGWRVSFDAYSGDMMVVTAWEAT